MKNTNDKQQVNLGTSENGSNVFCVAHDDVEKTLFNLFVSANESIDNNIVNRVGKAQYIKTTKMILVSQGINDVKDMEYGIIKVIHIMTYISGHSITEIPSDIVIDINRKDEGAMELLNFFSSLIKIKEFV